ncbi:MAG: TonB-dependent receptor, partial [Proteobacteria bacterium]|nr:TonB-dependent receptor [Pseudomonadota bacterium]
MISFHRAAALAAALAVMGTAGGAVAQTSGGTTDNSTSPPAASPSPTPTPPANGTGPAPSSSPNEVQLPEVQVIEQQAKPVTPKKIQKAAKTTPKKVPVAAQPTPPELGATVPEPTVVQMSPVGGSEIPIAKVPGSVGTVSSSDVTRSGVMAVQDVLQSRIPGVIVNDLQGNEFQTNVQFHGFEASPLDGVPQGLAVYENGVRINEAFGDVVNWDFLPSIAIADIAVMTNNPAFGLNALGGSISISMKDGFNFQGVETDIRGGSFGRIQGSVQAGQQVGNYAAYIAIEDIHDGGWRQFSPSDIRRTFADIGFKNRDAEFHANFTGADNFVGAVTASPIQLLDQSYSAVYTNPQTTQNDMAMGSVNGAVNVTNTLKVSGVSYYRRFNQHHVDANGSEAAPCSGDESVLCFDNLNGTTVQLFDQNGNPVLTPAGGDNYVGEIDRTSQQAESYGASLQGVQKAKVFDHNNQFLLGGSVDHGRVGYQTDAEIGSIGPNFTVTGDGQIVANSDIAPVDITTTNTYYGIFFSDTFDVTDRLSLTAGGR